MAEVELIIDAGHGGVDPGAVKGELEKDWTLKISQYQYDRFQDLGIDVALTRNSDITLEENARVNKVKKAKYCISNHLNAGGGDRAEVIHSIHSNDIFGQLVAEEFTKVGQTTTKIYSRKGSNGDYYYMHRRTGSCVTNIVEYCFLDNVKDFKHFKANWKAYAEAVVKAYCKFRRHTYKAPSTVKAKPDTDSDILYTVQVGAYRDLNNAKEIIAKLSRAGFQGYVKTNK